MNFTNDENVILSAVRFLRDNGCAVSVFLPAEIPDNVKTDELEEAMVTSGLQYIKTHT